MDARGEVERRQMLFWKERGTFYNQPVKIDILPAVNRRGFQRDSG